MTSLMSPKKNLKLGSRYFFFCKNFYLFLFIFYSYYCLDSKGDSGMLDLLIFMESPQHISKRAKYYFGNMKAHCTYKAVLSGRIIKVASRMASNIAYRQGYDFAFCKKNVYACLRKFPSIHRYKVMDIH